MKKNSIYLGITILSLFLMVSQVSAQYEKQNNLNQTFRASLAPTADIEEFRREFDKVLVDLQYVFRLYMEIPGFRGSMEKLGTDPAQKLEEARQVIRNTKPDHLVQMREIMAKLPEFGEFPRLFNSFIDEGFHETLESRLRLRESGVDLLFSLIEDLSCPNVRGQNISYADIAVARGVVTAAAALVDGLIQPQHATYRFFAIIVRVLAEGASIYLEMVSDRVTDCKIDEIKQSSGGHEAIQRDVTAILDKGAKEATLLTRSTQTSVNVLQSSVDIVQGKVDAANLKLDQLLVNLAAFQAQNLRLQIEDNLANGNHDAPIAQFELPAEQGGYLDLVRSIVVDTLQKLQAAGEDIGNAASYLSKGDDYRAEGEYKKAYKEYRKAYEKATK